MFSGHPWSAGGLHITLTLHVNDSVSLLFITGGDGIPAVNEESLETTEFKNSVKESFSWKVSDMYTYERTTAKSAQPLILNLI